MKVNAGMRWHRHNSKTESKKKAAAASDTSSSSSVHENNSIGMEANKWTMALRSAVQEGNPIPKELIYHERIHMWKTASRQEKYYQTHDEEKMMKDNCERIAARIKPDAVMVDFGSGDSRKMQPVLDAIETSGKPCTYAALDLDMVSLEHASQQLHSSLSNINIELIADTFPRGNERLSRTQNQRVAVWLGSTLVLDSGLVDFSELETLMRPGDLAIIGLDCHTWADKDKIELPYHSEEFEHFVQSGIESMCGDTGLPTPWEEYWEFGCNINGCAESARHCFELKAKKEMPFDGGVIPKGQIVTVFCSRKSDRGAVIEAAHRAGFEAEILEIPDSKSYIFMLSKKEPEPEAPSSRPEEKPSTTE